MGRSLNAISFDVAPHAVQTLYGGLGGKVIHAYPLVSDWPAGTVSDNINPRSHGEEVLDSPVAKAMAATLKNEPHKFVLANRGLLLLASRAEYVDGRLYLEFGGNPAVRGLADGGTTDAVLAARPMDPIHGNDVYGKRAQVHIEIVVSLDDPDLVAALVEGRNTSRQVRQSSLVNASGRFDWLKEALPPEMRTRIAWEENQVGAAVPVSEALAVLNVFREGIGRPIAYHETFGGRQAEEYEARRGQQRDWSDACFNGYRDRSKLAATLRDEGVLAGFAATAPVAAELLGLYDEIYAAISDAAERAANKTKSAHKEALWKSVGSPVKGGELPFTGRPVARKVHMGWVLPVFAATRQFWGGGKWLLHRDEFMPHVLEWGLKTIESSAINGKMKVTQFVRGAYSFESGVIGVRVAKREAK